MATTPPQVLEVEDELPALQTESAPLNRPELMIWSDDETCSRTYSLPPNASARFHTNRRRSSAASSRRNSLSSTHSHSHPSHHSHHSGSSCRTAYQSNYVAQHLRRASIIESRKARLADRAAHAEQVRLRAAQAKAAPRGSNTEEKAAAAQQAREKYLAKVAAACAEEVNRAKRIAEEWKERKAAEERKQRLEFEEKQTGADRRRSELLRTPRKHRSGTGSGSGFSVGLVEAKKPTEAEISSKEQEAAALRIQRAWKSVRCRRSLTLLGDKGLSIDQISQSSFIEATDRLADEVVIANMGRVLARFGLYDAFVGDTAPVRTFLSAFMILAHPDDVFSKDGQQEQELIEKAKNMLVEFERAVAQLDSFDTTGSRKRQLKQLSRAHSTYMTAFAAWKAEDAPILIETMVDQFVALDVIWLSVKDDTRGEVANDYREGIRTNQIILLSKLKKLAGSERANALIKTAIRQSRRSRSARLRIGDVRPRQAGPQISASEIVDGADVVTDDAPNSTRASSGAVLALQDQGQSLEPQNVQVADLSRVFSILPPNRTVVHELLIDPSFRVEVSPHSDVRNALNREVCENMRRGIADGQDELWTIAVAENVRARLLKLLQSGSSMHQVISGVLDPEHIRDQCRQGMFSYERFFAFMADLLPRLCAPVRDAEVQAFVETLRRPDESTEVMIEKLFGLLHIIDLLSLDHTNYVLQQAAPTLIREGIAYEQRVFEQDLAENRTTLQRTKHWWRDTIVNILTEGNSGDVSGPTRFQKIYVRGLVDLALSTIPLQNSYIPETLALDTARLLRIRADMLSFTTVGGILLTAKNLLRRDVRTQWKPEAKRILDSVERDGFSNTDGELAARILGTIESGHQMPASSREHLSSIITRFLSEAHAGRLADPVLKLLFQRLKLHVQNRLLATSSAERVRVATTASEGLASIGLSEFVVQIGAVAEELGKVASVDQATHSEWYRQIAEEVERAGDGDDIVRSTSAGLA